MQRLTKIIFLALVSFLLIPSAPPVIAASPTPSPSPSPAFYSCVKSSYYSVDNYIVFNNQWNTRVIPSGTPYSQCVTVNSAHGPINASWTWLWPLVNGEVKAYPEIIYGMVPYIAPFGSSVSSLPVQLSKMNKYAASFDTSVQADTTAKYNTSFDLWTTNVNPPTTASRTNEIMIMLDWQNPWFNNPNPNLGVVTIDGQDYRLIRVPGTWIIFVFVKVNKMPVGTINVDKFLDWLITNGHISASDYLTSIEFGTEVVLGSGTTTIRSFSINESSSSTPTPIYLTGDINHDGVINIQDYTLLSNAFGTNNAAADLNSDGTVNVLDYIILSNNFGKTG